MRRVLIALVFCGPLLSGAAAAQGGHTAPGTPPNGPAPPEPPRGAEAQARYPQPVLVGSLSGRQVIENTVMQRVLGRVAGAVRGADGVDRVLIDRGGVLGFGTTRVAVPVAVMALLGELVVLHDLTPDALSALPEATRPEGPLPPDATIRIGLARN
jgi:hypothetical protein